MFNIEFEYFKSVAKIASEALNTMSLIWEQMQFNGTEPQSLAFGNEAYPFEESFDEVSSRFAYWLETLEEEPKEEIGEPETAEEEKPTLCNYTEAIAFASYKLRTAIQDVLNAVGDCYEITEEVSDKQNIELDTATNHIIYAVADTIAEYLDF